jgi:hypothetical protein
MPPDVLASPRRRVPAGHAGRVPIGKIYAEEAALSKKPSPPCRIWSACKQEIDPWHCGGFHPFGPGSRAPPRTSAGSARRTTPKAGGALSIDASEMMPGSPRSKSTRLCLSRPGRPRGDQSATGKAVQTDPVPTYLGSFSNNLAHAGSNCELLRARSLQYKMPPRETAPSRTQAFADGVRVFGNWTSVPAVVGADRTGVAQ